MIADSLQNQISIANSVSNRAQGDIREILASSAVPGATMVSDPVTDVSFNADDAERLGGPSNNSNAASRRRATSGCALFAAMLAAGMHAL